MSTSNRPLTRTFVAANDFRTVGLNLVVDHGGNFSVAGGHRGLGVLQSRPNSGQHGAVTEMGDIKCLAGAIVTTPGYPLTTAASGFVIAANSGASVVGRYAPPAGAACASGDMITMIANFPGTRGIGAGSGYV
jgi:hypothetical protein